MSQRRIVLNSKQLHWKCRCSTWYEDTVLGTEFDVDSHQYPDIGWRLILAGFPDVNGLSSAISAYNTRQFTYKEDALPAISGLLSVLSRSFQNGFLFGLPEMFFDRALGWRSNWLGSTLKRRNPSNRPKDSLLSVPNLPSWSWIGWRGEVGFDCREASRVDFKDLSDIIAEETIPITTWHTSDAPSGSPVRRIRSTWFENRDRFKDPSTLLPVGWSREKLPPDSKEGREIRPGVPDWGDDWVYRHCNMPDVAW